MLEYRRQLWFNVVIVGLSSMLMLNSVGVQGQMANMPSTNAERIHKNLNGHQIRKPDTKEQEMSLVISTDKTNKQNAFIQIIDPPSHLQHLQIIQVEYKCESEGHVGIDIRVWTDTKDDCIIFYETWTCSAHATKPLRKRVQLTFPDSVAFLPSLINPKTHIIKIAVIKAWIVEKKKFKDTYSFIKRKAYDAAFVRSMYNAAIKGPLERPKKSEVHSCINWYLSWKMQLPYTPKCAEEILVENALTFPVALSGNTQGVHKSFQKLKDPTLEAQRKRTRTEPQFTLVLYVYVLKYCDGTQLCSIMQRLTWDDNYMTPLVFMNKRGNLHIQIATQDSRPMAFITNDFAVPLKTWTRLILRCRKQRFEIAADWGTNWNKTFSTWYRFGSTDIVYFDDTAGMFIFGGSDMTHSFKGYIGEVLYYRTQAVATKEIPFVSPYHPMFELHLVQTDDRCTEFESWLKYRVWQCKALLKAVIGHRSCSYFFEDIFHATPKETFTIPQCAVYGGTRPRQYRHVNKLIRRMVLSKSRVSFPALGEKLYKDAVQMIEDHGFGIMKEVVPLLKQASCYKNHDASFLLAAIWSKGIGVKAKEIEAVSSLMRGALTNNRLCLMALGNKHVFGLDGAQKDLEIAYTYYKNIADKTKWDREKHAEEDVFTEAIRLTDEESIEAQTDEEGDLFMWFKHQASQGMVHAQRNMGRLLFWGAQGVRRDLKAAAEYYRLGAENGDPQSMHDYGLVLLKGQGVKENATEALYWLKLSAENGHVSAFNALGWYALERDHNLTEALQYFNESYQQGNADAAHNIGHMMQYGRMPDGKKDKINCFKYFAFGAARGQLDSALQVAQMNMRGHPLTNGRNAYIAMDWARFVSEQNPTVGGILSKGLKAYSNKNWEVALLYYILAAETGLEVGNFNLAYLCEENNEGSVAHVEKECQWTHFNLSTQRYEHQVDPYAWIKMGDYYWYGCQAERDPIKASEYYTNAAARGDPHAIFNLGFLVEQGVRVPFDYWKKLQIDKTVYTHNVSLLYELYSRCSDSYKSEAYVPCSISYYRVQMSDFWHNYHHLVKLSTALGVVMAVSALISSIYTYIHSRQVTLDAV